MDNKISRGDRGRICLKGKENGSVNGRKEFWIFERSYSLGNWLEMDYAQLYHLHQQNEQ